ncbi:MAG: hypothetical protein H6722_29680 [Sandaracinus sp.]|nr:hypothetical protein [Sandaracinus sp.]
MSDEASSPTPFGPTPELGPLASVWLARRHPVRDPHATADRARLTAVLSERGLPSSEAVVAFEARFGGVRFTDVGRMPGVDFVLGAYALLKDDPSTPKRGSLVPVVLSDDDVWYFLDSEGIVWAEDVEDPEPVPFATAATIALARLVLYRRAFEDRHAFGGIDREGHHAEAIARTLGLPPIAHATDRLARFFGDAESLVIEHEVEGEPLTTIVGRAARELG